MPQKQLNYRAVQVIARKDALSKDDMMGTGTNFIGKLISSIDTRDTDGTARVILPYGASATGNLSIPANSILIGTLKYLSGNERIYINFNKCLFPDGQEYKIEAQALDSSDYRSGVFGETHSNSVTRIGKTVALSMAAAVPEVLTERIALGDTGTTTVKATMNNVLYQGTAKAANVELEKQVKGFDGEANDYVTIDSGEELIVSLTNTFKGELINEQTK